MSAVDDADDAEAELLGEVGDPRDPMVRANTAVAGQADEFARLERSRGLWPCVDSHTEPT
ncbi:hypothetical protein OHR68_13430 [Spirillospora sp. NBC_00431]